MTKFPEIFNALAAEFDPGNVKMLPKGGKQFAFISARTVMNRLDDVLGPENWHDEYVPGEHSVMCRLTICLPTGETVTKVDAGAYAGMTDQGDDDKSGFSDALKRAAAKFGVGRYLYGDGQVYFVEETPHTTATPHTETPHTNGKTPPTTGQELLARSEEASQKYQTDLTAELYTWAASQKNLQSIIKWTPDQVTAGSAFIRGLIKEMKAETAARA